MPRKKSQKRKRVKRNKDGTLNKKDLAHNVALYKKYMFSNIFEWCCKRRYY